MIFGQGNVIDASACFGKDSHRLIQNMVWYLRTTLMLGGKATPALMRDLARGERLMALVHKRPRQRRPLPKFLRAAHDDSAWHTPAFEVTASVTNPRVSLSFDGDDDRPRAA